MKLLRRVFAAASPVCQVSRKPPAQSGRVGNSPRLASVSLLASANCIDVGTGSGARGGGAARHAFQNGVNTR